MSEKKRKRYSREFKMEAVRLITEKGYSMAEASLCVNMSETPSPW
jgi:transposase-like protein